MRPETVQPEILAHRGLALEHSENTLGAFRAAIDAGATALELDVHLSADGQIVVFHDEDLSRVWKTSAKVRELTVRQLTQVGDGENVIPTLQQVIDHFPGIFLNIDVKVIEAAKPLAQIIEANQIHSRVRVASFSRKRRLAAVRELSLPVAQSAAGVEVFLLLGLFRLGWVKLARLLVKDMDAVQIPMHFGKLDLADSRFISWLKELELKVHFWSINDPATMKELVAKGASGIVTDRCDVARATLYS